VASLYKDIQYIHVCSAQQRKCRLHPFIFKGLILHPAFRMSVPLKREFAVINSVRDKLNSCYIQDLSNASLTREGKVGEFDWDQNERGLLLGSYYYGYTVMQVK
jgi:hypothetical protein